MQKRALAFRVQQMPIPLDPQFPLRMDDDSIQRDDPITHLHVHDCMELGYCHEGQGLFVVGAKVLPFRAEDVVLIPPGEVHLARSAPGTLSRWTWLYLDPVRIAGMGNDWGDRFDDPTRLAGPGFTNVFTVGTHPRVSSAVCEMVEENRRRSEGWREMVRALLREVMVRAARTVKPRRTASTAARKDYHRLAPALQEMASAYQRQTSVEEMARRCGLSEAQFRRVFRRTLGMGPQAYRNGLRLRMAVSMLQQSPHSILEISQMVGFETLSSFNRQFRAVLGLTPREVRAGKVPEAGLRARTTA